MKGDLTLAGGGSPGVPNGFSSLTVVIPSHNGSATIARALASCAPIVRANANNHLVVVDDGSTDDTAEIVESVSLPGIRLISQTNKGRSAARNTGYRASQTTFVMFLDDDDVLVERGVRRILEMLAGPESASIDLIRVGVESVSHDATTTYTSPTVDLFDGSPIPGSFAARRELLEQAGGYDEHLSYAENSDLLFRLERLEPKVATIDCLTVRHFHRRDGATHYRRARIAAVERMLHTHDMALSTRRTLRGTMHAILANDYRAEKQPRPALLNGVRAVRDRPIPLNIARLIRTALEGAFDRLPGRRHRKES